MLLCAAVITVIVLQSSLSSCCSHHCLHSYPRLLSPQNAFPSTRTHELERKSQCPIMYFLPEKRKQKWGLPEHEKKECFWIHINNPHFCFAEFVLQCAAVCCSLLQRDAACCSVWQCVAVCCSKSSSPPVSPQAVPPLHIYN